MTRPLYTMSLSSVIPCLPIFVRTQQGASVYNGQIQVVAESTPGASNSSPIDGFTMAIPNLAVNQNVPYHQRSLDIPACIPNVERRIGWIRRFNLPLNMLLDPNIAKVSKLPFELSDYEVIKNLVVSQKILTYANIIPVPNSINSIFLFVDENGKNYLGNIYYDRDRNQIFPPQ